MNEETRDEAGRLVSVVVDGQRFHRADDAELVESLERVTEARDAFKDERNRAVAEVRSLRGVVQAVRDALAGDVQAVFKVAYAQQIIIDAGLAAAADAPQPTDDAFVIERRDDGSLRTYPAGPSPAVLPQPSEDQR